MAKHISQKPLLTTVILILLICVSITNLPASSTAVNQDSELVQKPTYLIPSIVKQNKPISLIVVQQGDEWLFAGAAPAAAKIRQVNKTPILLKWASKENPRQKKCLSNWSR